MHHSIPVKLGGMAQLTGKLVLLVDDSETDATLLRREFNRAGLTNPVTWLKAGREALAYLGGEDKYSDRSKYPLPSILLLDLKMPGIDGFEVLKWISARPELKRLLVVVLSGLEDSKSVNLAYELGANSYLTKPVNPYDLANMVNFFKGYWMIADKRPDGEQTPNTAFTPDPDDSRAGIGAGSVAVQNRAQPA